MDVFLSENLREFSRASIQSFIRQGFITVNGRPQKSSYHVQEGDCIAVEAFPEEKQLTLEPENIPLDILFEDDAIAVINKPAGMTVHPGVGAHSGTLTHALLHHFNHLSDVNGTIRPGIVHRLDKNTSGVIIIAKTNLVHRNLAAQFQERKVSKTYLGLTWGRWNEQEGTIDGAVKRKRSDPTTYTVDPTGKEARTDFRIKEELDIFSLVEFRPRTGRTHQIRIHAAYKNHPIVGDVKYGGSIKRLLGYTPEVQRGLKTILKPFQRHFLHAWKIEIIHPTSGETVQFVAPVPKGLNDLIQNLKEALAIGN